MRFRKPPVPKTCAACNETFTRDRDETATNYARRKTCGSYACNRAAQNITKGHGILSTDRTCETCGGAITPHTRESAAQLARRRFCSHGCATTWQRSNRPPPKPRKVRPTKAPRRLAPKGYVWSGRFPTPKTVKSAWQPITGPDAPTAPVPTRRGIKPSKRTEALLAAVFDQHPDLIGALAEARA